MFCNFSAGESEKEFIFPFDNSKAKNIYGVATVHSADGSRIPIMQLWIHGGNKFMLIPYFDEQNKTVQYNLDVNVIFYYELI